MKQDTGFSEKLTLILEHLRINRHEFAKILGYKRSQSVYDIVNGKSKPSFDFFNKLFLSEYGNIFNPYWLFTGQGKMLMADELKSTSIEEEASEYYKSSVALVAQNDFTDYLSNYNNSDFINQLESYRLPLLKNNETYRMFQVIDNNMAPLFRSGSYVVSTFVEDWNLIESDAIYTIVSKNNQIITRRVVNNLLQNNSIICKSDANIHDDFNIEIDNVIEIWKVSLSFGKVV